jgi:hypothetical protein
MLKAKNTSRNLQGGAARDYNRVSCTSGRSEDNCRKMVRLAQPHVRAGEYGGIEIHNEKDARRNEEQCESKAVERIIKMSYNQPVKAKPPWSEQNSNSII